MSWMRSKSDNPQSETPKAVTEPQYNRDMKSTSPAPKQARSSTGSARIGQSILIEGTLTGNEDLTIDGRIQGKIKLNGHSLTIGPNGKIGAGLCAKEVIVQGEVNGDITADEKIQIMSSGSVAGDLWAPRIALDDGARFAGSVDMVTKKAPGSADASTRKVPKLGVSNEG
jgi:cytoskeletal protein CcmA (bactofilin family)